MTPLTLNNKWFPAVAFTVLFLSVILFSYTDSFLFLAAPVALLYLWLMGVNWKAAYFVFLAIVPPSIQLSFAGDTMSITLPDEPLMWLFLLLGAAVLAQNPRRLPMWWWKDEIVMIAVFQFIWLCVAVIFSHVPFLSFKFLLSKIWLMVCYFIFPVLVFNTKRDYKIVFKLMFATIFTTVVIILYHHYTLRFQFDRVQEAMGGLYYNHVDYSSVISMFFPLLVVAYPLTKSWARWLRNLWILVIVIFLAAIFYSYARAAVLAVVFAIAIGLAMRMKLVNFVMPCFYAAIIGLLCYMVANNNFLKYRPDYDNTYMHKEFSDHMMATFKGKDMSSMERLYRWIAAIRMSRDEPIKGYGPHGFYYNYQPYAISAFKTYVSRNPERSTTHNYFLYMLVEQGWPAMLLYAILIPAVFAKAQRTYHRFKDKFYRTVTIGLAMTIAAGFINNFFSELIETHKVGALFYIPVCLLVLLEHKSRQMEAAEANSTPAPSPEGW
ncbi:MAG: O-antigen ligase family protein [Chitinophagia bacterium]|nr:O-antigen ligase family protein [Chitinophagia bacterium]